VRTLTLLKKACECTYAGLQELVSSRPQLESSSLSFTKIICVLKIKRTVRWRVWRGHLPEICPGK